MRALRTRFDEVVVVDTCGKYRVYFPDGSSRMRTVWQSLERYPMPGDGFGKAYEGQTIFLRRKFIAEKDRLGVLTLTELELENRPADGYCIKQRRAKESVYYG